MLYNVSYEQSLTAMPAQVATFNEKQQNVKSPYRYIRSFEDPSWGIGPDALRGTAVANANGDLFYIDLLTGTHSVDGQANAIDDLGIRVLKALPAKGNGNKKNPNAWAELMDLLGDEAPEAVQKDLKSLFKCGPLMRKAPQLSLS